MLPGPGEVLHFSEDPSITAFEPHVAVTAQQPEAYVWACGIKHAPSYWFPRQCPRAMAWRSASTTEQDRVRILGAHVAGRVHAIEYRWLPAMQETTVYAYRLPDTAFVSFGSSAMVATVGVEPLGPPEPIGDLLALHEAAGIELRLLDSLWPWWNEVVASTVGFSGIRMRNASPSDAAPAYGESR